MSFSVGFFDGDAVDVVVGAERDDFEVGRDVVNDASADAVDVKVVGIHESHTAQQEYAPADFAQRLVGGGEVHFHDRLHKGWHADLFGYKEHVHRQHRRHEQRREQGHFAFGFGVFGGFADTVEEAVEVHESVDGEHFSAFGHVDPVDYTALRATAKQRPGFLHELTHYLYGRSHHGHGVQVG